MIPSDRLHGLDAVRGFALLLGVALHGANAYVPDFPGWVVTDTPSRALSASFYVIHIFRMTLFFLIAGFFARLALHRKGRRPFVRDRLMRVGVPLVAGWFVLMPAMGAMFVLANVIGAPAGAVVPADAAAAAAAAASPAPPQSIVWLIVTGFPLGHLWFLYMLLGFYAIALAVRAVVERADRGGVFRRRIDAAVSWMVRSHASPLILGAPALVMFLTNPEWRMWFGIPSPIAGLVPDSTSSVAFGAAFAFGWVLHRQADLLRLWERRWKGNMALAIASTAAMLVIAGPTPIYTANTGGGITALYALLYVVAIWTWSFAIVGAALRFLSGYDAARRYVADASYWIYLAHVPIVMGLHVVLSRVPAPPEAKFLIVVFVATLVCLAMYQMFVRYTFIGVMLNGRRGGTVTQPAVAPAAAITNP